MLGESVPFSSAAQFTKISDGKMFINSVAHKSFMDVNEESREDVVNKDATTLVYDSNETIQFVCNRPFIYVIHDNEFENIFFVGKYVKPNIIN